MQIAEELKSKHKFKMCVPLTEWGVDHDPADTNLIYRGGYWPQIVLVRDHIAYGLFGIMPRDEEKGREGVWVVSEHTSKSVRLPVMYFRWMGLEFMLRYNYHSWNVTVKSPEALELKDIERLIDTTGETYMGFEGFPEDFRCPHYGAPEYHVSSQFSADVCNDHQLYTFFWLIRNAWHVEF